MNQKLFTPLTSPGQIGLIVLLTMTVLMTVGLSVATRSSQDLINTQRGEESNRVFNAAEAGIEAALSADYAFEGDSTSGDISGFTDITGDYTIAKQNTFETRLFEGVSVELDVTGVVDGQGLTIDWSREDNCGTDNPASLVATIFFDDAGTTRARYMAIGACDRGDNFTLATTGNYGNYRRTYALPLQTDDEFVRIRAVYNDTHIKISGNGWTTPTQLYQIRAEAQNDSSNENRAVSVGRTLPTAPSVFDFALYSGTTIVK